MKKNNFFVTSEILGIQIWRIKLVNYNIFEIATKQQIFNPHALFFFLLKGATIYYHAIYIVFTYFASFTGYANYIFEVISNLNIQGSKIGGKLTNLAENLLKN